MRAWQEWRALKMKLGETRRGKERRERKREKGRKVGKRLRWVRIRRKA